MKVIKTKLKDVVILEPKVFHDERGFFLESWNLRNIKKIIGSQYNFVQENQSHSSKGVLRGLHYQIEKSQGKLLHVIKGSILDVAVDLRKSSPTFGEHISVILSSENFRQLWIPPGFAHGFSVISREVDLFYKTTDYYAPEFEQCISYDDKDLAIDWNLNGLEPNISLKDAKGVNFKSAQYFP